MTFEDSATVRDYTNYTEDSNNNNILIIMLKTATNQNLIIIPKYQPL